MMLRLISISAVFLSFAWPAGAALRVAHIFQDHMVLQREKPVPVWGWADAGADVKVEFGGQEKTSRADEKGRWKAVFDSMPASADGRVMTVSTGAESLSLKDILVGEVWLCSGQSNMARTLKNDSNNYPRFNDYANDAEYPQIRFINYSTHAADTPLADFDPLVHKDDRWKLLNKATAFETMSIPFFFAKDLHKKLGVPIGLVEVAVPGTPQTSWLARETLDATTAQVATSPSYDDALARARNNLAKGKETYKDWEGFLAAEKAWKANPTGRWPGANLNIPDFPCVLYNAMIHPVAPMAIRGVLWHQGEGGPAVNYRERLQAQVAHWRKLFGQDFYFLWGSMSRNTSTAPPMGPEPVTFRGGVDEEFLLAAQDFGADGRAVLVNFFDLGNQSTHWGRKEESGHRMARAALAKVYGEKDQAFSGPELIEAKIDGATVRAKFRYVGGGLVYEPSIDGISGFLIEQKGVNPEVRWADVRIEGDTVVLSHPEIKNPTNAYYGWHSNPHETLFNKEGYTATPFRALPRSSAAKSPAGPALVELTTPVERQALNVSHVRRKGYIFSVQQDKASGKATVRARLPREWKGAIFTLQGKPVEVGTPQIDVDGYRVYEFSVDINGPDITVADTETPPDFSRIERY